jgi:hypothetical protein
MLLRIFVAKVRGEVFAHFHAVAVKLHSSICKWLFGLPGWIICEQSPLWQRKLWSCSWLCSLPISPFLVSVSLGYRCTALAFFTERLPNYFQDFRLTFSEIYTKFDAVPLSDSPRNRIRPDTRLAIKEVKSQHVRPPARNFVHRLPRYASTIIYLRIALLLSRKLQIPLVVFPVVLKWRDTE